MASLLGWLKKANPLSQTSAVRDFFDANTQADYARRQRANPSAPRQTYSQQQRSLGNRRPYTNPSQLLLGSTARLANTVGAIPGEAVDTAKVISAILTRNNTALANANRAGLAGDAQRYRPDSGLLRAGTIYDSPEESRTLSTGQAIRRGAGTGAGAFGEISPLKVGGILAKSAPVVKYGGRFLAGGAQAGIGDVGEQAAIRDKYNPYQTAAAVAFGGTLPLAGNAAGAGVRKVFGTEAKNLATKSATRQSIKVAQQTFTSAKNKRISFENYGGTPKQIAGARQAEMQALNYLKRQQRLDKINRKGPGLSMEAVDGGGKTDPIKVYRGGSATDINKAGDRGISVTTDRAVAERFANRKSAIVGESGQIDELTVKPNAKILDASKVTQKEVESATGMPILGEVSIVEYAKKNGYDVIDFTKRTTGFEPEAELRILNTSVLDLNAPRAAKTATPAIPAPTKPTATPSRIAPPATKVSPPIKPPININRYDLDKAQKATLEKTVKQITPELEKVKGGVLKNKDVIKAAQTSDLLRKVTTKKQTQEAAAALLRTRQNVASLDAEITRLGKTGDTTVVKAKMADMIEGLRVVKSHQADAARKLQSGVIGAGEVSGRAEVLSKIAKVEQDTDKIVKAAASVDWDNAEAVTEFYRSFIKPSMGDILKEYRYNNMLSSPKTHMRNAFSNVMQTFAVRPTTIALSGHPLQAFKYEKGAVKALPEAFRDFAKAWSGKTAIQKPDLKYISTGKLPKFATIPTRAMEASDVWFQKIISSGELARGATAKEAQNMAEYSLFRGGLHPKGQGPMLNRIDDAIGAIDHIRTKVPSLGWVVPFLRTPMNFAKQWVEYNPVTGPLTMIGAKNKKEQLAKSIIGSVATAYGASLAMEGRMTWAAPTDAKEKELFYASGKKPFSIKVGDKWVPMIYSGPLTMALAIPAAAKYYQDESKTALTDTQFEKLAKTVAGMGQMWTQQTFVQGIGSFVNMVNGDVDYNLARNAAGLARQVIPFTGLMNYVASVMDPIYRKPSGFTDNIKTGIPQLSKSVKPYTDPNGNPSTRLPVNKFLPYDIGQEKPEFLDALQARTKKLQSNNVISKANQTGETSFKQLPDGRFTAKVGDEYKAFDSEADAQKAVEKDAFDKSGKNIQMVGDKVYRRSDSGYIITQTKTAYEYQLGTAQLTKFKKNGDVAGWMKTAEKQLERIEQQLKDPDTDPLEAARLENQAQYLLESAAKYQSYGGFTKGRSGRSSASLPSGVSSALKTTGIVSAPKVPNIRITKPTYKKAALRRLAVSKLPKVVG